MPKTRTDPDYIKLNDRLIRGNVTDLRSGFSLSGLDVQEFPEDEAQAAFVRTAIRAGKVEDASEDEYDATNGDHLDFLGQQGVKLKPVEVQATWQEGHAHQAAVRHRHNVAVGRGLVAPDSAAHYDRDQARRERLIEETERVHGEGVQVDRDGYEAATGMGSEPARAAAEQHSAAAKSGRTGDKAKTAAEKKKEREQSTDTADTASGGTVDPVDPADAGSGGDAAR